MTKPSFRGGDRTCPRCSSPLVVETLDGKPPKGAQAVYRSVREGLAYTIWIDRCPSCLGAFFDNGELERGLGEFRPYGEREVEVGAQAAVRAITAVSAGTAPATSRPANLLPERDDEAYDPDDVDSVLGYLARRMNEPWHKRSGVLRASDEGPTSADLPAISTSGDGPTARGVVMAESCPKCRQAMVEIVGIAPGRSGFRCVDCGGIWLDVVRLRRRGS